MRSGAVVQVCASSSSVLSTTDDVPAASRLYLCLCSWLHQTARGTSVQQGVDGGKYSTKMKIRQLLMLPSYYEKCWCLGSGRNKKPQTIILTKPHLTRGPGVWK